MLKMTLLRVVFAMFFVVSGYFVLLFEPFEELKRAFDVPAEAVPPELAASRFSP